MNELISASARELATLIREGRVSSVEVVDAHLRRIEEVNPKLNAVVQLCAEAACREAERADAALARGELRGPLHGVPITLKDSLDTAGVVTTWGTPGRAGFIPARDATAVARLRAAGAILLGKTNTPELTLAFATDNPVYGRTCNPYDLDRTPGGSSGGAAAIVAAGGSPLELGSDTGGSIRLPAHFCGIAGIRPTSGRVPRTGHAIPPGGLLDFLTQVGPLARTVDDLGLALPLVAGVDPMDPWIAPVPLGDPAAVDLGELRIAFHVDNGIAAPTPEIAEGVRATAKVLSDAGCRVSEDRPPGIEETFDLFGELIRAGGAGFRLLLEQAGTPESESSLGPLLSVPAPSLAELAPLLDRWDRFRVEMLGFLEGYDAIVSPVHARPALPLEMSGSDLPLFSYTMTYNLTGWPAGVVRVGTSPEGLPLGVQVAARPWREDVVLAALGRIESALGGWQPPPL